MVKQAVFNRLYSKGQKNLKKREQVYTENKNIISSECTFTPTLSPVRKQQRVELTDVDVQINKLKQKKNKIR